MNYFNSIKAPDDIAKVVADNARLDMVSVKCFCSEKYGKYISCFIDVGNRAAPFIARTLNGDVVGDSTVSLVITIPPDFCCGRRDEGQLARDGKCLCRRGYSKANPRLSP